jgi:hypothetical protein
MGLEGEVKLDRRGGSFLAMGPSCRISTEVSSPGSTGGPEVGHSGGAVKGRPRTGCCNGCEGSKGDIINEKNRDGIVRHRTYLAVLLY